MLSPQFTAGFRQHLLLALQIALRPDQRLRVTRFKSGGGRLRNLTPRFSAPQFFGPSSRGTARWSPMGALNQSRCAPRGHLRRQSHQGILVALGGIATAERRVYAQLLACFHTYVG